MKKLASTLCQSPRTGQVAMAIALVAAFTVTCGAGVGIATGLACLVAYGVFGSR